MTRRPRLRLLPAGALAALAALALTAACDGNATGPVPIDGLPRDLTPAELRVVAGSNALAFGLLREATRARSPDSPNVFLSPLSASMALGMTLNGTAADTWSQMRDVLGFDGMDEAEINGAYRDLIDLLLGLDGSVEFGLGNAIFARQGVPFHDDFLDRARTWFDARVQELDFADPGAPAVINAWVDDVTRGRIEQIVDEIPPEMIMYLVNAIYFQGDWRARFDPARTAPAPFALDDGGQVTVEMMHGNVGHRVVLVPHPADGHTTLLELPYAGGAFTAVAVLPRHGDRIDTMVEHLDEEIWAGWMARLDEAARAEDPDREGAPVAMPKLELEWERVMNDDLAALGMPDAFDRPAADFTRLTPIDRPAGEGPPHVFISEVRQKTFLQVDEEGTTAAAATSVGVGVDSAPLEIRLDRPFLLAIRERFSGTILFIGVIGDPAS